MPSNLNVPVGEQAARQIINAEIAALKEQLQQAEAIAAPKRAEVQAAAAALDSAYRLLARTRSQAETASDETIAAKKQAHVDAKNVLGAARIRLDRASKQADPYSTQTAVLRRKIERLERAIGALPPLRVPSVLSGRPPPVVKFDLTPHNSNVFTIGRQDGEFTIRDSRVG